jgi:DNA-binding transcriptional MerR regulator
MLIGELAQATGTTVRALRYYEQQGLLRPRRAPNRYRDYDETAVQRVRNIRHLLSLGFTAEDIHAFLPCLDHDIADRECPASAPFIAGKLATLDEKIAALTGIRDRLAGFLDRVNGERSLAVRR